MGNDQGGVEQDEDEDDQEKSKSSPLPHQELDKPFNVTIRSTTFLVPYKRE
jgi:hypothetical protein